MAKKKEVVALIKLQITGGSATPAPPVGPALGARGVNIGEFVKRFNDATASRRGDVVPVVISVYKDKSFEFILREAPVSEMVKKAAGITKGSAAPNLLTTHATITREQVREIATRKMGELTAHSIDATMAIVEGTARTMSVKIAD